MHKDLTMSQDQDYGDTALIPQDARFCMGMGWMVAIVGFLGFFLWAALAPLDKGVATSGTVIVSGNRKAVQALSDGIVEKMNVEEGERVTAGQTLVRLRQRQVSDRRQSLYERYLSLLAEQSRLLAEKTDADDLVISAALQQEQHQPGLKEKLDLQRQLLQSRRRALQGETAVLAQSLAAVVSEQQGLEQSAASKSQQLAILGEQANTLKKLMASGHLSRHSWLDAQRNYAEVESELLELKGYIEQRRKQQQEIELRQAQLLADRQKEIYTQLAGKEQEINECRHQLSIADVDLANTLIVAPVSGTVVGLTLFTEGGVVQTGEHLMAIVPENEPLVVEARLAVNLIDRVATGLPVTLMFSAFNQNQTPRIPGEVVMVAADSLIDSATGSAYYPVHIAITAEGKALLGRHNIKPGMGAEVFIRTGSRSLLNYLFKPVTDRARLALTEE